MYAIAYHESSRNNWHMMMFVVEKLLLGEVSESFTN